MIKYWTKNRIVFDLLVSLVLIVIVAFAFVLPIYNNIGEARLIQSLYENDSLDFDIPSPTNEQINELESKDFVASVFPYYYTKTTFKTNASSLNAHLLLSDSLDKIEQTMYCSSRCIEKIEDSVTNPLYADYAFIKSLGVKLKDTVSITIGSSKIDFQIAGIYETNTYYEGGAVLAKFEGVQKDAITANSPKLSYSGAYICANDMAVCKQYLETNYKPMGRLKDASEFSTHEAYQTHYNAFMSANYANEITNFDSKKNDVNSKVIALENSAKTSLILAIIIILVVVICHNIILWSRKSEKGYFARKLTQGNSNIAKYYVMSSITQAIILMLGIVVTLLISSLITEFFIPIQKINLYNIMLIASACMSTLIIAIINILLIKKIRS